MSSKEIAEYTKEFMERMKLAQEFKIVRKAPDGFEFNGPVPFTVGVKNDIMTFTVYAPSVEEAEAQVTAYLNKNTQ